MAATRRRGPELERAIHAAVLAELSEHGYHGTTYEAVAARAGTSKPVLYRRWPTKAEMVLSAKAASIAFPRAPDTGDLREDLVQMLASLRGIVEQVGRETMLRLLAELDRPAMEVMRAIFFERGVELIGPVLDQARERGDLPDAELPARLVSLPLDLARHEIVMMGELPDDVVAGIVDDVVLPALRAPRVASAHG